MTPTPEREQYDEITADIRKADRARDFRTGDDLRELRDEILEDVLTPSESARVSEIDSELQQLEFDRSQLSRPTEIDRLLKAGAIHKTGPNTGEINEPALIRAAGGGRGVDEIADDLIRQHPELFRETDESGTTLDQDDQLRRALEARQSQRDRVFKAKSTKQLTTERDSIINRALDGKSKFETRSVELKDQPVAISNAEGRFNNLSPKTKRIDLDIQAKNVAPEIASDQSEIKLQRRWMKDPTQLDFEGIDERVPRRRSVNQLGR